GSPPTRGAGTSTTPGSAPTAPARGPPPARSRPISTGSGPGSCSAPRPATGWSRRRRWCCWPAHSGRLAPPPPPPAPPPPRRPPGARRARAALRRRVRPRVDPLRPRLRHVGRLLRLPRRRVAVHGRGLTGGSGVDLFPGVPTRPHHDVEIAVAPPDLRAVRG